MIQNLWVNCYSSKVIMKEFEFKRIKTKNGDNSKVELWKDIVSLCLHICKTIKIKMQNKDDDDICFLLWLLNGKCLIHLCLLNI